MKLWRSKCDSEARDASERSAFICLTHLWILTWGNHQIFSQQWMLLTLPSWEPHSDGLLSETHIRVLPAVPTTAGPLEYVLRRFFLSPYITALDPIIQGHGWITSPSTSPSMRLSATGPNLQRSPLFQHDTVGLMDRSPHSYRVVRLQES